MHTVLVTTVTICAVISSFVLLTSYDLLASLTFGRSILQYYVTAYDKTGGLCPPAKPVFTLYSTSVIATLSKLTLLKGLPVWDLSENVALKQESNHFLFWESYEIHKYTLCRMQNLLMLLYMVLILTFGLQVLNYLFHQVQIEYISMPDTFWFYSLFQDEYILDVSQRKNNWIIFKVTDRGYY